MGPLRQVRERCRRFKAPTLKAYAASSRGALYQSNSPFGVFNLHSQTREIVECVSVIVEYDFSTMRFIMNLYPVVERVEKWRR